ncbi:unnamed protein product [Urochloa humidicola]
MEAQLSSSPHLSKPPLVMCHRIRKQYTSDLCKVWNRPHVGNATYSRTCCCSNCSCRKIWHPSLASL